MKKIFVMAGLALAIACSPKIMPQPTQMDADNAASKFPGLTLAELNEGKAAYETHCNKCHGLKNPARESEAEWRKIVPPMAKKAKIDADTENKILKYVVAMSNAANAK